jgi:hypothetical protein
MSLRRILSLLLPKLFLQLFSLDGSQQAKVTINSVAGTESRLDSGWRENIILHDNG